MNANYKAVRKAVRKSIRAAVSEYKISMLGKRSCVDCGGRHWSLEYGVNEWSGDAESGFWDCYSASGTEREMFNDLKSVIESGKKICVVVRLICEDKTNAESLFNIDGTKTASTE